MATLALVIFMVGRCASDQDGDVQADVTADSCGPCADLRDAGDAQADVRSDSCSPCADLRDAGDAKPEEALEQEAVEEGGGEDENAVLMNCGDGWISCVNGKMYFSATGHVGPGADCESDGYSWLCLSGICGLYELCEDDIFALKGMLPATAEWANGSLTVEAAESPGGLEAPDCRRCSCAWTLTSEEGTSVLKVTLEPTGDAALGVIQTTPVEGTTNVLNSVFPPTKILSLELNGSPVDANQVTLRWAPLPDAQLAGERPEPGMGRSAGLVIESIDGGQTTLVWLLRAESGTRINAPVEYALQAVTACSPYCDDVDCGSDGCGGSCGECPDGESCVNGACAQQ